MDVTEKSLNQISKFYKSFSGTDTLAFILLPGCKPVVLGTLTTISYSIFRNKKPVINIGRTNINGVTRGSRIIAGTMIFTLINQHWLRELQEQEKERKSTDEDIWLAGFTKRGLKADEMPVFDIMIISANEYGNCATMFIWGIDVTDEAQTISVEDLFTENVFSFVARDVTTFEAFDIREKPSDSDGLTEKNVNGQSQKFYVIDGSGATVEDLEKLEQEIAQAKINQANKPAIIPLARPLYFSSSNVITGDDVVLLQQELNKLDDFNVEVNGVFDAEMDKAIKKFQSLYHCPVIDGVVTEKIYNDILNATSSNDTYIGVVVNKYGAYTYKYPDITSDIVDMQSYGKELELYEVITNTENEVFYKTESGYVKKEDIYSAYYMGNTIEFPIIQYKDKSEYVRIVQNTLAQIFPDFNVFTGVYDKETMQYVQTLQEQHGLSSDGTIDNDTWLLLQSLSGNVVNQVSNDNFNLNYNIIPGTYTVSQNLIMQTLTRYNSEISCDRHTNIKMTCISYYDKTKDTQVFTKSETIKEAQEISPAQLLEAFIYNPKHGCFPSKVEYIVYPYGKKALKWTFLYS